MRTKQPVAGNLIQYHASQNGRMINNQNNLQIPYINPNLVTLNSIPSVVPVQPVIYYQNTLPNLVNNYNNNNTAGFISVQPQPQPQSLPFQYVTYPYSMPQQQMTPIPTQYVYYNQVPLQQPIRQQLQPMPQIPVQQQQQQQQQQHFVPNSNVLVRSKKFSNLNSANNEIKSYKILNPLQQQQQNIQTFQPTSVETLSPANNNIKREAEESQISILVNRQKNLKKSPKTTDQTNNNNNNNDRYKDLIYKPRNLTSNKETTMDTNRTKKTLQFDLNEEDEENIEPIIPVSLESSKSSLPSILTSQSKLNSTTSLLTSRPKLVDDLKLPIPRRIPSIEDLQVNNTIYRFSFLFFFKILIHLGSA